jgi:hypothetical protein
VIEDNILFFRYLLFPVFLSLLLFFALSQAAADDDKTDDVQPYKWFFTLYGGAFTDSDLEDDLTFNWDFGDHTYIIVGALARELWRYEDFISFEVEGQLGKYFGQEHQGQINGLIIARWLKFPWDQYVDTSFAVGDGLSYNTETSKVEEEDDEDAGKWLSYLMFELTLGLPKYPRWNFVYRIHHRSSIRGRIGAGASNFVAVGIKYSF